MFPPLWPGALTSRSPRRYSLGMDYTQFFRELREAQGLTLEELATRARCHRNTVVNVESGRPVKFKTIAHLMAKMGYATRTPEVRAIALLWLDSVTGIPFSKPETIDAARQTVSSYREPSRRLTRLLENAIQESNLTAQQIGTLTFAAHNPELIDILANIEALTRRLGRDASSEPFDDDDDNADADGNLLAAEDGD